MNMKCCNKWLVPKINFNASIMDIIGLTILLSFFLSIAALIAYGASGMLVGQVEDGTFGDRHWYGRTGGGTLLLFYGLYKLLPKFINACSYLVNYTLNITSVCASCNKQHLNINLPSNNDPF